MPVTVRVIRTYEVNVDAQFGDSEEEVVARGRQTVNTTTEYEETAVLLPGEE